MWYTSIHHYTGYTGDMFWEQRPKYSRSTCFMQVESQQILALKTQNKLKFKTDKEEESIYIYTRLKRSVFLKYKIQLWIKNGILFFNQIAVIPYLKLDMW